VEIDNEEEEEEVEEEVEEIFLSFEKSEDFFLISLISFFTMDIPFTISSNKGFNIFSSWIKRFLMSSEI
jgi:hypothetical protein